MPGDGEINENIIVISSILTTFELSILIIVKKFKVSEILKMLKNDGWYLNDHRGTSHRQFKHPIKKGKSNGERQTKRYFESRIIK